MVAGSQAYPSGLGCGRYRPLAILPCDPLPACGWALRLLFNLTQFRHERLAALDVAIGSRCPLRWRKEANHSRRERLFFLNVARYNGTVQQRPIEEITRSEAEARAAVYSGVIVR